MLIIIEKFEIFDGKIKRFFKWNLKTQQNYEKSEGKLN